MPSRSNRFDANQEDQIKITVNKYLAEHELAYEGKYSTDTQNNWRLYSHNAATTMAYRKNDNISHFICRLAYCRNEELRKWFLTQESRLFNLRLQSTSSDQIKEIIISNFGLNYESVKDTDQEWREFREDIAFNAPRGKPVQAGDYIKVPFKEALNLVATRQVYVRKGIAYVPT